MNTAVATALRDAAAMDAAVNGIAVAAICGAVVVHSYRPKSPQIAQNRSMRTPNVHFILTKIAIANQTQLTPLCFGYDRAALCAPSLVGELSVTLRDLPHTLFGGLIQKLLWQTVWGEYV